MADKGREGQLRLLATGLVHKLRNSLNAMRTHVALVQRFASAHADEGIVHQIDRLEQAIVSMEEAMREFLAFADPAPNRFEEVDLPALIDEVLSFLSGRLEQQAVEVEQEFSVETPGVYADRAKLKQAVLNLVLNSCQAMPAGGRLTVRAALGGRGISLRPAGAPARRRIGSDRAPLRNDPGPAGKDRPFEYIAEDRRPQGRSRENPGPERSRLAAQDQGTRSSLLIPPTPAIGVQPHLPFTATEELALSLS